ncbi:MAG TPA: AMP-dependent synthetase, partial [Lutibacter sp.]|nr:AMP-dependent synthetase [Lutibacter sp.]
SLQIEAVINSLDFVKESAAIAVSPPNGGPDKLIIYFVENSKTDAEQALSIIKKLVKTQINPLFKVSEVLCIDKLPRTASGKVMRKNLRKAYRTKV